MPMPLPLRSLRTKSQGAGEDELIEDDAGAELVATTAGDEEGALMRTVCDAFAEDDGVGEGTVMGRARADDDKDDADGGEDADGGIEGGAVARGATVASDEDAEGGGTVRCTTFTQDDDGVEEILAAGFTTWAGTDDGAVDVTTVRGGTEVRTACGLACFVRSILFLFCFWFLAAIRAVGAMVLASLAAVQQTWHFLRGGKLLILMNLSWFSSGSMMFPHLHVTALGTGNVSGKVLMDER